MTPDDRYSTPVVESTRIAIMAMERIQRLGATVLILTVNSAGKIVISISAAPPALIEIMGGVTRQHGMHTGHLGGAQVRWFGADNNTASRDAA